MAIIGSAAQEALLVLTVLRLIPRHGWISTPELEQSLAEAGYPIESRRLQRILQSLRNRDEFGVECNTKSKPFGYRRRVSDSDLGVTRLRPQECLLLRLAEEHLKYQLPSPILKSLEPLFDAARLALKEAGSTARQREWLGKVAFVPDSISLMPPKILPRIFDAVSEALYRDSKLEIEYVSTKNKAGSTYTVSPLALVQQENRLYLVCRFENYDNVRHLALHRIKNAKVLEFAADRPKDFSLKKYVDGRHVNYSNGSKILFVMEFSNPDTARILTETPFNRTQKLTQLPEGGWRLEAVMDDTVLLDGWVAAWKKGAGISFVEKRPVPEA